MEPTLLARNNWINAAPTFFNHRTGQYSSRLWDVVDVHTFEWDYTGLLLFLQYGYCVFGRTPIADVHYIEANQELWLENGKFVVKASIDPMTQLQVEDASTPDEVYSLVCTQVSQKLQVSGQTEAILPLSGGYDSRYLAIVAKDLGIPTTAFTFDATKNPEQGREIQRAKWVAQQLGFDWHSVSVSDFGQYTQRMQADFGVQFQHHNMPHYAFWAGVQQVQPRGLVLSGLIGDGFAGKVAVDAPSRPEEVPNLGLSYGVNASPLVNPKAKGYNEYQALLEAHYATHTSYWQQPLYRLVYVLRLKMMMLYPALIQLPAQFGYPGIAPFIDFETASAMMRLPEDQKQHRQWQVDFFKARQVLAEVHIPIRQKTNVMFQKFFTSGNFTRLNPSLLKEIVPESYTTHIIQKLPRRDTWLSNANWQIQYKLVKYMGKGFYNKQYVGPYFVLLTLQGFIERRNAILTESAK